MGDLEDDSANVFKFNDWESLPSPHYHRHHRNNHHNHDHHLSIFPPNNHEDLPIPSPPTQPPPPPHAPLSFSNSNSDSDSLTPSPSPPPKPQLIKWFDFAFQIWSSKLLSFFTLLRSRGFFSLLIPLASTASFLGVLWLWVWRRKRLRSHGGKESIKHLKLLIKEKDEKIVQLLEQISQLNKHLLARYRVPVIRSS